MEMVECSVLDKSVNSWVLRVPGRQFPGVLVQGDSLRRLYSLAKSAHESLPTGSEASDQAAELRDQLKAHLMNYETALRRHGIALPYAGPIVEG